MLYLSLLLTDKKMSRFSFCFSGGGGVVVTRVLVVGQRETAGVQILPAIVVW